MTDVRIELEKLSKEQIIGLIQSGALSTVSQDKKQVAEQVEVEPKPRKKSKKKKNFTKRRTQEKLDKIKAELVKGKTLTVEDINKMFGETSTAHYLISRYLKSSKWAIVEKVGKEYQVKASGLLNVKKPKKDGKQLTRRQKLQRGARNNPFLKFRNKRLQELYAQGMGRDEAYKKLSEEYNRLKEQGDHTDTEFPKFQSVDGQYLPILKSILDRTIKGKTDIDFKGVSYALDLRTAQKFVDFAQEVIEQEDKIKQFFGIKRGKFKWNGKKLSYKG